MDPLLDVNPLPNHRFFFWDSEIGKRWTFSMISWGFAMFAFRVSGDQNIGKWESGGDSCTQYSSIPSTIEDVTIFVSSFGPQLVMGKRVIGSHLIKRQQTQTSSWYVNKYLKWHIYIYIYIYVSLGVYIYIYIYIYTHIRATPPVLPHNFLGILKEYKFRPPLNFTFKWEDQQGY